MSSKLIINGRWVLTKDDQWRLSIDPYVEVYSIIEGKLKPASAFLLANLESTTCNRVFNNNAVTMKGANLFVPDQGDKKLSITNLGDFSSIDGWDYQFYLLLEPCELSPTVGTGIFEAFVDDIQFGLDEDDEPLDLEILKRLNALKSPTSITCNKNKSEVRCA